MQKREIVITSVLQSLCGAVFVGFIFFLFCSRCSVSVRMNK